MSSELITAPTEEPITLAEAKDHVRLTASDTSQDTKLGMLIKAATRFCELWMNRRCCTQTWKLRLDNWPCYPYIELPYSKLVSVTSVVYKASDGTSTTMPSTDYVMDKYREPGIIQLAPTVRTWPTIQLNSIAGIEIQYVCGYGAAGAVPEEVKNGILMLLEHMFENRGDVSTEAPIPMQIPKASEFFLFPHRVWFL